MDDQEFEELDNMIESHTDYLYDLNREISLLRKNLIVFPIVGLNPNLVTIRINFVI